MSNDTTPKTVDFSTLELQRDPTADERFYQVNENLRVVEAQITRDKSEYKGFTYFRPVYASVLAACAAFGEEIVLDLINAKVATQVGVRVGARIESELAPRDEKTETVEQYAERRKRQIAELLIAKPTIFTASDAVEYVPGERELSATGIVNKIKKLMTVATQYFNAGKVNDGLACYTEVGVLNNRLKELMEKQAAAAQAAAGNADAEVEA